MNSISDSVARDCACKSQSGILHQQTQVIFVNIKGKTGNSVSHSLAVYASSLCQCGHCCHLSESLWGISSKLFVALCLGLISDKENNTRNP